jgi:hypothetical protein
VQLSNWKYKGTDGEMELMVLNGATGIQGNKGDTGLAGSDGANGIDGS